MASIRKRTWTTDQGTVKVSHQVDYLDQHGKRRRKQFKRKKDADAFLVRARGEVALGIHTTDSNSITVAAAADIWLSACELGRNGNDPIEVHTARTYDQHARLHIKPLIGKLLLSQLTTPRIAEFRDELLRTRSQPIAKMALTSLKSILTEAQTRGLVVQNVALPVKIATSRRHKKEVSIPDKIEVRSILELAEQNCGKGSTVHKRAWRRYHALLTTAAFTGMRASELRGLYWDHVDFLNGVIHVKQRADYGGTIGSVKSEAGRRKIPMSAGLAHILRQWKIACPTGDLVFPNWKGNVDAHRNTLVRCWWPICKQAGLVDANGKHRYKFHHLRHFRASMLIASDATPKEVQTEMGHSSIQITFDVYGHLFPDNAERGRDRADTIEAEILG